MEELQPLGSIECQSPEPDPAHYVILFPIYYFTWAWVGCQVEKFSPVVTGGTWTCDLLMDSQVL